MISDPSQVSDAGPGAFEITRHFLKTQFLYKSDNELIDGLSRIKIDDSKQITFAVVVPMFNESANVVRCISTINDFLKTLPFDTKIIAIDDASYDDTFTLLESMQLKCPRLKILRHEVNAGYGGANVQGINWALNANIQYLLFMDADLTQDIRYIKAFIPHMQNAVDVIKATRYSDGGGVSGVPFRRWLVSYVGNIIARTVLRLKLTDYTNGFRAIRTELFRGLEFKERGFPYLIEEVVKINAVAKSFANVPYVLTVRQGGCSKFTYSFRVYFRYLSWLVRLS